MSDDRTWEMSYDRTPYENLRALMRHIDRSISNAQILRIAFARIPGLGPSAEPIVEAIRQEFEHEHAVAWARRWLDAQNEPPTIALNEERRSIPSDTDGVVHPAEVRAVVAHQLGGRTARTCENPDGVIECTGPDEVGFRCPECTTQRRREEAILDELLRVVKRDGLDDAAPSLTTAEEQPSEAPTGNWTDTDPTRAVTDGGPTEDDDRTEATRGGLKATEEANERNQDQNGQFELRAFANGGDGGTGQ